MVRPESGLIGQRWAPDRGEDLFARQARFVCEAYGRELAALSLKGRWSRLDLHLSGYRSGDEFLVEHRYADRDGPYFARVSLPEAFQELPGPARRTGVVLVISAALEALGTHEKWDTTKLEQLRTAVTTDVGNFSWTSRWKSSPDRRRRARAVFTLQDDGMGRVHLEVTDASAAEPQHTREAASFGSVQAFRRSSDTLTWHGSHRVSLSGLIDAI